MADVQSGIDMGGDPVYELTLGRLMRLLSLESRRARSRCLLSSWWSTERIDREGLASMALGPPGGVRLGSDPVVIDA